MDDNELKLYVRELYGIDVFISYAHADEIHVKPILLLLEEYAKEGWINHVWSDENLAGGAGFEKQLEEMMHYSKLNIIVLSNNYLVSKYCMDKELPLLKYNFEKHAVPLLPIWFERVKLEDYDNKFLMDIQMIPKFKPVKKRHSEKQAFANIQYNLLRLIIERFKVDVDDIETASEIDLPDKMRLMYQLHARPAVEKTGINLIRFACTVVCFLLALICWWLFGTQDDIRLLHASILFFVISLVSYRFNSFIRSDFFKIITAFDFLMMLLFILIAAVYGLVLGYVAGKVFSFLTSNTAAQLVLFLCSGICTGYTSGTLLYKKYAEEYVPGNSDDKYTAEPFDRESDRHNQISFLGKDATYTIAVGIQPIFIRIVIGAASGVFGAAVSLALTNGLQVNLRQSYFSYNLLLVFIARCPPPLRLVECW